MNKNKAMIALVLGGLLSACASVSPVTVADKEVQPLNEAEVCCTNYSAFPWQQLGKEESLELAIDDTSPVAKFEEGFSRFQAFEFSPQSGKVSVQLESIMADKRVFAPVVVALDASFQVQKKFEVTEKNIRVSDMFTRTHYRLNAEIDADKTPYLVVYTDPGQLSKQVKVEHPAKVRAKEAGEPLPIVVDPVYVHANSGELELVIDTKSLSTVKKKSVLRVEPQAVKPKPVTVQPETQAYYHNAIETAVAAGDIPKALSLLDEAKALNIEGAQEAFVKAVNSK